MKKYLFFIVSLMSFLIMSSCNQKAGDTQKEIISRDTSNVKPASDSIAITNKDSNNEFNQQQSDFATYYINIADTGKDYFALRNKMFELNKTTQLSIDTLGRYYNKKKKMIVAERGADEFYADEYFPRRFPSESMSLEYLSYYKKEADKKTIALVTGVYENEKTAAENYSLLTKAGIKPLQLKTEMYIGCIH